MGQAQTALQAQAHEAKETLAAIDYLTNTGTNDSILSP